MSKRLSAGTSLIEILVVIVIFLVGILALVQVFPPGLATLRATSGSLMATTLANAEIERLASRKNELPDYVATVRHIMTPFGTSVVVDASKPTRELMPPVNPLTNVGSLDSNGNIIVDTGILGDWMRVSASNRISRVLGESHAVPAPRTVHNNYGSLVTLNFAPIYYFLLPAGIGEPGVLQVYGNDMTRKIGDTASANPIPAAFGEAKDWEFYFVEADRTDPAGPFPGVDQIWFGPADTKDVRIALSFAYDVDPGPTTQYEHYDIIVSISLDPFMPPPFASIDENYWIISLPALVGQPDIYGRTLYNPANVGGVYRDSLRMQRLFQELSITGVWDTNNPYQYKVINGGFGTILVNPAAFDFTVKNESGISVPLRANADYTVYDWRVLRDEFRVPNVPGDVKLVMSGIKPLGTRVPDGRKYNGLGIVGPSFKVVAPTGSGGPIAQSVEFNAAGPFEVRSDDFVLLDIETGGIIVGNAPNATSPLTGYQVDKSHGYIQLRDTTVGGGSIEVPVAYATGNVADPWDVVTEDVSGHVVRALYMANGEWSAQLYRAAARYRETDVVAANGLQASEFYVGDSVAGTGSPTRIYFPLADLGQRVNVGEIYYRDTVAPFERHVLRDQNLILSAVENVAGIDHAYVDLSSIFGANKELDDSLGYSVRRVRGASITVRVLHNNTSFSLGSDPLANYLRLETWSRNWEKHETESYSLGGGS